MKRILLMAILCTIGSVASHAQSQDVRLLAPFPMRAFLEQSISAFRQQHSDMTFVLETASNDEILAKAETDYNCVMAPESVARRISRRFANQGSRVAIIPGPVRERFVIGVAANASDNRCQLFIDFLESDTGRSIKNALGLE